MLFREFADSGLTDVRWSRCSVTAGGVVVVVVVLPWKGHSYPRSLFLRVIAARNHFHLGSLPLERSVLTKITAILGSLLSGPWKGPCCSASGGF